MRRREFVAGLTLSTFALPLWARTQGAARRPRLLIAEEDPFTGLTLLRARYAAGMRPSEDILGQALRWRLTGDNTFAHCALRGMKSAQFHSAVKGSNQWEDYASWSLAFDWMFGHPDFDRLLQEEIAQELADGAARMLALPALADSEQVSYQNQSVRYLALAMFCLAAIEGYADYDRRCGPFHIKVRQGLENILQLTDLVTPRGSYHESMDYMRITWASLVLLTELQRTTQGFDPAQRYSLFRNIGDTYLYKLLPDGTPSREGDNEYPILDCRDTAVIGYAVNRFKDPYAAWLLRRSGFFSTEWVLPVLQFLWNDPEVTPLNPAEACESELPRQKYFPGVGHLVMRNGWEQDATWIEFDCGPYFAKHQHLDQNQITIYHKGYLAIDSGVDYTEVESPHYLNYYRRTVAHNSMLVYDQAETFFWSDDLLAAANDGGQRMDSSRFWNTVRSLEDWNNTRDLWDLGTMRIVDYAPGRYHYALGDATKAYSPNKVSRFTRETMYFPEQNLLFVFDRVTATSTGFRKAWLLHGVNAPDVDGEDAAMPGVSTFDNAKTFRFVQGDGELLVHSLLPRKRTVVRRGGAGDAFYTPGNDAGGPWGSGRNWPLDPADGGPLPADPKLRHMWETFWGKDATIERSNRKNVVPGAWRIEVSPATPTLADEFLHVFEIGGRGETGNRRVELMDGANFTGAAFEDGPAVLFGTASSDIGEGEVSLPALNCGLLVMTGLSPHSTYQLNFSGLNVPYEKSAVSPGVPVRRLFLQANGNGLLCVDARELGNLRLRIARI